MDNLCNVIESISLEYTNAVLWTGGDFNIPDTNWNNKSGEENQYSHSISELFLEMMNTCGL